jgi:hypothetical protein
MLNRDGTCRIPYDVYQRIDIGCKVEQDDAKVIAAAALSIAARDLGVTIPINELAEVTGLSRDEIREVSRGKADLPRTDDDQGLM